MILEGLSNQRNTKNALRFAKFLNTSRESVDCPKVLAWTGSC